MLGEFVSSSVVNAYRNCNALTLRILYTLDCFWSGFLVTLIYQTIHCWSFLVRAVKLQIVNLTMALEKRARHFYVSLSIELFNALIFFSGRYPTGCVL